MKFQEKKKDKISKLSKAMSISRGEIFRRKKEKISKLPKAMSISRGDSATKYSEMLELLENTSQC